MTEELATYKVLGVMSGTSLDGLDLADCHFSLQEGGKWQYAIKAAETLPYTPEWITKLNKAHTLAHAELAELDWAYTQWLSKTLGSFIKKQKDTHFDAVCSHGHTVLHQPEKGITLQMGNLPTLVEHLPCPAICDFRTQDVALGGQGAPLVPVGDQLLFADYDGCLNLGGFANLSKMFHTPPMAYDICAFNRILNPLAQQLGHPYDEEGRLASKGRLIQPLFDALNQLPFYAQSGPKSLGREWVEAAVDPLLNRFSSETVEDLLHTCVHHCAYQIGAHWQRGERVLLSGGGAHNAFFVAVLATYSKAHFVLPNDLTINFKEALVFGFLGVLKMREEINCYAAVTGAQHDHVAGKIFFP